MQSPSAGLKLLQTLPTVGISPELKKRINLGCLFIIMLVWSLHLAYPIHRLQLMRWAVFGYVVPIYYFFTVALMAVPAVFALSIKRRWSRWEVLWWLLPLICLPGIVYSSDRLWSLRQWLSWIIRGIIPGGIIFLGAHTNKTKSILIYWIYPIIIAASLLGLIEIYSDHNPLWDSFYNSIPQTAQPFNPFYRPDAWLPVSPISLGQVGPRGTQGNRIIYAATLIGFLPFGLWLLKHKKKFFWANLSAIGALFSILVLARVRAVWVGTIIALILINALGLQRNWRETSKLAVGILLCFGTFLIWPKTSILLHTRLHSFSLANNSIRERLEVLQTINVLKGHWLFGVGFGQFPTACKSNYPSNLVWNNTPDNEYFRWLIENGVFGSILLFTFLIGLTRAGWEKIKQMEDLQQSDFYKAILIGWLSTAITFLFFDGFYWGVCNMTFWVLLGLFATCLNTASKPLQHN